MHAHRRSPHRPRRGGCLFWTRSNRAGIDAALAAESEMEAGQEEAIEQWALQVERAQYEADRAERRYRSVEPENRLVARTLELEWEKKLSELAAAKTELEDRQRLHPRVLTEEQHSRLRALGADLRSVWSAPNDQRP